MSEDDPTKPRPKEESLGELTEEEEGVLYMMGEFYKRMGVDNPEDNPGISFMLEHQRLGFLLTHALEDLCDIDRPLYLRVVLLARMDYQRFLDAINSALAQDPMIDDARAEHFIDQPIDLSFSGLMTNDGHDLRAGLISWLADKPHAEKFRRILERLQELLPEDADPDF